MLLLHSPGSILASFVEPRQILEKGQKLGLIKFGSQCDIDLPFPLRAVLLVAPGDKVQLGQDLMIH